MRELIDIILENEQPKADGVNQLINDIKAGEIAQNVLQAISAYVQKVAAKITTNPATPPLDPAQAEPAQAPAIATEPAPETNPNVAPENEVERQLEEAAKMELPDGVTLKPADLGKLLTKHGFATEEVNNIVTYAYRKTIEQVCANLAASKQYKREAGPMIAQMFFDAPGTLSQRNHIAHVLMGTGVLDLKKFVKPGTGVLDDVFLPEYRNNSIVMNLKLKLKNRSDFPTQVSAANKGSGEDLITILGNPVNKLSPGDLNIAGKEIEIKAMGARLKGFGGSTVYGDATRIYPEWTRLMTEALGGKGSQFMQSQGASLKKYFNFGLDNLNILSDALQVSDVKNRGSLVRSAFVLLLETLYVQSDTSMREIILRSFDRKTGEFDPTEFRKNWFLFSYDYYKKTTADKKTGAAMHAIMFVNQGDEKYQIVTDIGQIESNWNNYQLSTDLFTWNNPTGSAPKITLGKETRERKVKVKPEVSPAASPARTVNNPVRQRRT